MLLMADRAVVFTLGAVAVGLVAVGLLAIACVLAGQPEPEPPFVLDEIDRMNREIDAQVDEWRREIA